MLSKATRKHLSQEGGESLVELLVTIAIISIAIVVLVGALADAILASASHRQHATANTVARNVAETLKDRNTTFVSDGNYPARTWAAVNTAGYAVTVSAKCWAVNSNAPATFSTCPNGDFGLQEITVTATANAKGEKENVTILKRKT